MSALVQTDSMKLQGVYRHFCQAPGQKEGRSLQCQVDREQCAGQNPCHRKVTEKGSSLPHAQQCRATPTLFQVRKDAEGPTLLAVVWGTSS